MTSEAIFLIIIIPLIPFLVLAIGNKLTGWDIVAKHYRFKGKFKATQNWYWCSAFMGIRQGDRLLGIELPFHSLRNCLNIAANESGMHVSLILMFRPFNPPLYIPWSHVSVKNEKGILLNWMEFRFRDAPSVVLRLRPTLGSELIKYSRYDLVA